LLEGGVGSDEEFDEDEESSDDSVGGGGGVVDGTAAGDGGAEVASRSQMRHKKFTFTIAFLERKVRYQKTKETPMKEVYLSVMVSKGILVG